MNRLSPVFIVGGPRSGTSLLRNLLRSHPRLTFPNESHFIPAFYRGYGDPRDEREARLLASRMLRLRWVQDWGLSLEPAAFADDRSFRDVLCRLYGAWAAREGRPRWGDKTPHYVMALETLMELFPAAKIVHIIRDGRDVALSVLKAGFGPRNLYTAAAEWKRFVTVGRDTGARLPPGSYMDLRYETLLARPSETMRSVCAFLDEPFDPAVLKPNALAFVQRGAIIGERRLTQASTTAIVAANCGKWKLKLRPSERVLFETVAGDLLRELGYETEGDVRSISLPERAFWRAHQQLGWVGFRLNSRALPRLLATELQMRWAGIRATWKAAGEAHGG